MFFDEWKDFVTCPLNSEYIRSRVQRLDTTHGFRRGHDRKYPREYAEAGADRLAIIDQSFVVAPDDLFECMKIDDFGYVTIWTREKVWFLTREGVRARVEKLRYVPRHPSHRKTQPQ